MRDALGRRYFREAWVPPPEVLGTESAIAPPPPPPPPTRPAPDPAPQFVSRTRREMAKLKPARQTPNYFIAAALLMIGTVGVLGITAWLASQRVAPPAPAARGTPASPTAAPAPGVASGLAATPAQPSLPTVSVPSAETADPAPARLSAEQARAMLDRLRKAAAEADPVASAAEFTGVLEQFEQQWPEMPGDLQTPSMLAIGERLLRATRAQARAGVDTYERLERPLAVFAAKDRFPSPGEVVSAVWSAGVLNAIKGDRSVPGRLVSSARTKVASLVSSGEVPRESTFAGGAAVALEALSRRWVRPDPADPEDAVRRAWTAWTRCAAALDAADPGASFRVQSAAIEALLREGEVGVSPISGEVLALLLAGVPDWRAKDPAATMLSWFDDPRIDARALSTLTTWASDRGPMAGVGGSMVLTPDATTIQRRELRDAYAVRLGVTAATEKSETARRWSEAARAAIAADSKRESTADALTVLAAAVAVARLNECASRQWALDTAGAAKALEQATPDAVAAAATPAPGATRADPTALTSPGSPPDGEWTRRFLGVSSESMRILLLNQLRNGRGPEGPADADVLAEAACFGSPNTVRQLAQQTIRDFADRPEVINALVEAIADAPRQKSVSDMIADVTGERPPPPSDPRWRAECRRSLVEKLMTLTGSEQDDRADALSRQLAEACAAMIWLKQPRLASGGLDPEAVRAAVIDSPASAAATHRDQWRDDARSIPEGRWALVGYDEYERRHAVRRSLVTGPVQTYVAERVGTAEMMGHVLAGERPSRAPQVRAVLGLLGETLRGSPTAFHQTLAVERAILRLWLIRFGEQA